MPKITHRKKRLSSFKLIALGFAGVIVPVSYTHLTLPTIYSV